MYFPDGLPAERIIIVSRKQCVDYTYISGRVVVTTGWWSARHLATLSQTKLLHQPTTRHLPVPSMLAASLDVIIKQTISRSRCWRKLTTCLQLHNYHTTTCLLLSLLLTIICLLSLVIIKHGLCFHSQFSVNQSRIWILKLCNQCMDYSHVSSFTLHWKGQ